MSETMDIKKALEFMVKYAPENHRLDFKRICDEIAIHLNHLVDDFINNDDEISRLRGEVERYKSTLNELCRLKAMKDQLGKTTEYKHFQPIAWRIAFDLLQVPYTEQLREVGDEE